MFKIGDRVALSVDGRNVQTDSDFNPHNLKGVIIDNYCYVSVRWDNGEENDYLPVHLQKINEDVIEEETVIEAKADRYNTGKAKVSMVDSILIEQTAKVLEFGAQKYDRDNWRKGLPYTQVCDSLLRHVYSFLTGENDDKESGHSHLGHAACNIMFLLRYLEDNREDLDDRYKEDKGTV